MAHDPEQTILESVGIYRGIDDTIDSGSQVVANILGRTITGLGNIYNKFVGTDTNVQEPLRAADLGWQTIATVAGHSIVGVSMAAEWVARVDDRSEPPLLAEDGARFVPNFTPIDSTLGAVLSGVSKAGDALRSVRGFPTKARGFYDDLMSALAEDQGE